MQSETQDFEGDKTIKVSQRQQHKHLKAAHDTGSIITTKRERKPIDKTYFGNNGLTRW